MFNNNPCCARIVTLLSLRITSRNNESSETVLLGTSATEGINRMTIEVLRSLITSQEDESEITSKIISLLKDTPSLAKTKDKFGRTLFHLLLVQGKHQVFEALLATNLWYEAALLGDRHEDTILHYIVAREDGDASDLINIVLEHLPKVVNSVNEAGNTALHEAVKGGKLWAVGCLAKCRHVDRTIKNKESKMPIDLAVGQREFKLLLSNVSSLDLRIRLPQPGSNDDLRMALPTLSSSDTLSSSSPKTSGQQHSAQQLTESDFSESEDEEDNKK